MVDCSWSLKGWGTSPMISPNWQVCGWFKLAVILALEDQSPNDWKSSLIWSYWEWFKLNICAAALNACSAVPAPENSVLISTLDATGVKSLTSRRDSTLLFHACSMTVSMEARHSWLPNAGCFVFCVVNLLAHMFYKPQAQHTTASQMSRKNEFGWPPFWISCGRICRACSSGPSKLMVLTCSSCLASKAALNLLTNQRFSILHWFSHSACAKKK